MHTWQQRSCSLVLFSPKKKPKDLQSGRGREGSCPIQNEKNKPDPPNNNKHQQRMGEAHTLKYIREGGRMTHRWKLIGFIKKKGNNRTMTEFKKASNLQKKTEKTYTVFPKIY